MRVHRSLARRLRFAPALVDSLDEAARALDCEVAYFMITSTEAGWRAQRVILACDPVWALEYEQRECFRSDPWLRYACTESAPISAADVRCISAAEIATVQLAAKFGFRRTALIPAPAPEGQSRVGLLALGTTEDVGPLLATTRRRAMAREFAMGLHESWVRDPPRPAAADIHLSSLEARLLELELEGLVTKAIARQVGITCDSIDSRFQRLNRRIGVDSRHEAALLCLELGLIKVPHSS